MKFVDRNDNFAQPSSIPGTLSFGSRINNGDFNDFGITAEDEYDIN